MGWKNKAEIYFVRVKIFVLTKNKNPELECVGATAAAADQSLSMNEELKTEDN